MFHGDLTTLMDISKMESAEDYLVSDYSDFDQQWLLVNAFRQAYGIGNKETVSYATAVALIRDICPELLPEESQLAQAFESELLRLYEERSISQSLSQNRPIAPIEILDSEIEELEQEKAVNPERSQAIGSQIDKLRRAKIQLDKTRWTESEVIRRDIDAREGKLAVLGKGQRYKEYRLANGRKLRISVLHPDPLEAKTGVDLIYETYYDKSDKYSRDPIYLVRIVVLQYKMRDGKTLYTSNSCSLVPQLKKMKKVFCESGFCNPPSSPDEEERYRLPYCCAFLRPTDKQQTRNAWRVTHAWHIPVCKALEKFEKTKDGYQVLRSKQVRSCAVTQDVFQELYNSGMLGSRFMNLKMLNEFYKGIGILDGTEDVVVHAQEY